MLAGPHPRSLSRGDSAPRSGRRRLLSLPSLGKSARLLSVNLRDLRTPSVLIDKTRLEQNIDRMQASAKAKGIGLRPHAKTHKSPDLARVQIARGAVGICCAKLGEAEVFAAAGIDDIRLPYPINPANADRVLKLLDRTRLSFIVDDIDVARSWSGFMRVNQREVDVLVKVDVGFHRCGIDPESRGAAELVARVAGLPGTSVPRAPQSRGPRLRRRIGKRDRRGCGRAKPRRSRVSRLKSSGSGRGSKRSASAQRRRRDSACSRRASPSCARAITSTSIARRSRSARLPGATAR